MNRSWVDDFNKKKQRALASKVRYLEELAAKQVAENPSLAQGITPTSDTAHALVNAKKLRDSLGTYSIYGNSSRQQVFAHCSRNGFKMNQISACPSFVTDEGWYFSNYHDYTPEQVKRSIRKYFLRQFDDIGRPTTTLDDDLKDLSILANEDRVDFPFAELKKETDASKTTPYYDPVSSKRLGPLDSDGDPPCVFVYFCTDVKTNIDAEVATVASHLMSCNDIMEILKKYLEACESWRYGPKLMKDFIKEIIKQKGILIQETITEEHTAEDIIMMILKVTRKTAPHEQAKKELLQFKRSPGEKMVYCAQKLISLYKKSKKDPKLSVEVNDPNFHDGIYEFVFKSIGKLQPNVSNRRDAFEILEQRQMDDVKEWPSVFAYAEMIDENELKYRIRFNHPIYLNDPLHVNNILVEDVDAIWPDIDEELDLNMFEVPMMNEPDHDKNDRYQFQLSQGQVGNFPSRPKSRVKQNVLARAQQARRSGHRINPSIRTNRAIRTGMTSQDSGLATTAPGSNLNDDQPPEDQLEEGGETYEYNDQSEISGNELPLPQNSSGGNAPTNSTPTIPPPAQDSMALHTRSQTARFRRQTALNNTDVPDNYAEPGPSNRSLNHTPLSRYENDLDRSFNDLGLERKRSARQALDLDETVMRSFEDSDSSEEVSVNALRIPPINRLTFRESARHVKELVHRVKNYSGNAVKFEKLRNLEGNLLTDREAMRNAAKRVLDSFSEKQLLGILNGFYNLQDWDMKDRSSKEPSTRMLRAQVLHKYLTGKNLYGDELAVYGYAISLSPAFATLFGDICHEWIITYCDKKEPMISLNENDVKALKALSSMVNKQTIGSPSSQAGLDMKAVKENRTRRENSRSQDRYNSRETYHQSRYNSKDREDSRNRYDSRERQRRPSYNDQYRSQGYQPRSRSNSYDRSRPMVRSSFNKDILRQARSTSRGYEVFHCKPSNCPGTDEAHDKCLKCGMNHATHKCYTYYVYSKQKCMKCNLCHSPIECTAARENEKSYPQRVPPGGYVPETSRK